MLQDFFVVELLFKKYFYRKDVFKWSYYLNSKKVLNLTQELQKKGFIKNFKIINVKFVFLK